MSASDVSQPCFPSIFNDVIGPVMRGPSSSHCAAALRIGRMARDLMGGRIDEVLIQYDSGGSLATTHASQGSDMGLAAGLMGWDATDPRLSGSIRALGEAGTLIRIETVDLHDDHPNTYRLTLRKERERHGMTAISCGGGMVEVIAVDGVQLSMAGDYHETLIFAESSADGILAFLEKNARADWVINRDGPGFRIIQVKAQAFVDAVIIEGLRSRFGVEEVKNISPVLPVLSRRRIEVPFIGCEGMLAHNEGRNLALWELAVEYESARGMLSHGEVFEKMREIVLILQDSIQAGLEGTDHADRILGYQCGNFKDQMDGKRLLDAGMLNRIILYVTALMEVKSSMGVIVAAPTAGSCGGLPGACIGAADAMGLSTDEMVQAMLAAGLVGVFIAARSTFAAELCGCQAECGAGSGMAAAALVALAHGSLAQAMCAASLALQNVLGMICDPVAGRVESPCLGKNAMAAANALSCANMALSGYDQVIPLDEVIEAMDSVGRSLPRELRCTALGGLSVTKTSRKIEKSLEARSSGRT